MILGFETTPAKEDFVVNDFLMVVGVLSGAGLHPGSAKRKAPPNPPSIAQVAAWNEFGTEQRSADAAFAKGSSQAQAPRPFMRSVLTAPGAKEEVNELFAVAIRAMNKGETDQGTASAVIGAKLVSDVQMSMDKWGVVDTGITKRHISWDTVTA